MKHKITAKMIKEHFTELWDANKKLIAELQETGVYFISSNELFRRAADYTNESLKNNSHLSEDDYLGAATLIAGGFIAGYQTARQDTAVAYKVVRDDNGYDDYDDE